MSARPALPRADDDGLDAEVGTLLFRSRRILWTQASHRLEQSGESPHAFRVLNCLRRVGRSTQRDLADATAQHPAGVSRLLDEMELQGLVRRRRDADDRRCVVVEMTAKGRARYEASWPHAVAAMQQVLGPLTVAERRQLRALLAKIAEPEPCSGDRSG